MSQIWKMTLAPLLVLILLATLTFGCAEEAEEKTTIVVGLVTDMTGPASSFLALADQSYYDTAKYINDNELIPGAEIKIVAYDCKYDPARDIPAYDWLRERDSVFIWSGVPTFGDTIKALADRDKYPILHSAPSAYALEPPGWLFGLTPPISWIMKGYLKWISESHWDYQAEGRKPKIGAVGWYETYQMDVSTAMEEYCAAHPDQFDLVGTFFTPMGGLIWSGEVEKLKDCDYIYIPSTGMGTATFAEAYRDRGYQATFIGLDAMTAFLYLLEDKVGWDKLDGSLTAHTTLYWTDDYPIVDKCIEYLDMYRPGQKEEIMEFGLGYISTWFCAQFQFDLLIQAVEDAGGVENLTSQAFYDTATKFNWYVEGIPERGYGFTDTIRYARKDFKVYEWKASIGDLESISGWEPGDVPNP